MEVSGAYEDSPASLRDAKELSITDVEVYEVAQRRQAVEELMERAGLVAENARDILPDDPLRTQVIDKAEERQRQIAARIVQSLTKTGHRIALTRRTSYQ